MPATFNGMSFSGGGSYSTQKFVLQKGNGDLFCPAWINFKSKMKDYLFDCPSLVEKIDNKTYKKDDIWRIVEDYNKCQ